MRNSYKHFPIKIQKYTKAGRKKQSICLMYTVDYKKQNPERILRWSGTSRIIDSDEYRYIAFIGGTVYDNRLYFWSKKYSDLIEIGFLMKDNVLNIPELAEKIIKKDIIITSTDQEVKVVCTLKNEKKNVETALKMLLFFDVLELPVCYWPTDHTRRGIFFIEKMYTATAFKTGKERNFKDPMYKKVNYSVVFDKNGITIKVGHNDLFYLLNTVREVFALSCEGKEDEEIEKELEKRDLIIWKVKQ